VVHITSAALFLKTTTKSSISNEVGGEKRMITLTKKSKIIIAAVFSIAIVLVIFVPFTSAQVASNNAISNIKTIIAKGSIYQTIDSSTIKHYPASLTLTVQPTTVKGAVRLFDVSGGTLVANGIKYTFTNGNGGVLSRRHDILLQAHGTDQNGQAVILKLSGQYSYSWAVGHAVLKIGAKLQTDSGNYTLLMAAGI
jgi:hypothetical protein